MKDTIEYLREIYFLLDSDRRKLPRLLIYFIVSTFFDLLGLGLIASYVSLIVNPESLTTSMLYVGLSEYGIVGSLQSMLVFVGLILLVVFLAKAFIAIWINHSIITFSQKQQVRLRSFLMSSYQDLPYAFYLKRNSSDYIYNINQLTNQYSDGVIMTLLRTVSDGIVSMAILVLLAWSDPQALLLLLSFVFILLVIYNKLFRSRLRAYGLKMNQASTELIKGIREGIDGLKEIRILGKEDYFHARVHSASSRLGHYKCISVLISTAPRYLFELVMVAFIILVILANIFMEKDVSTAIPSLSMFAAAGVRLIPSATMFAQSLVQLPLNRNAVSRLYDDIKSLKEANTVVKQSNLAHPDSFENLVVNKVSYCYPDNDHRALNSISLTISENESIGLIGPSGSGKTTLVDLLLGLLEPESGSVTYNSKNLKDSLFAWRSKIAYLPQEVFLMDSSIRSNIALGVPAEEIDEAHLKKSLYKARLGDLVEQLPRGLDTLIGERGIRLSGGQKQRVAIARAFYHNRSILVMDEATSALDYETEQNIVDEIKRLKGKITIIVIAHRLSTVKHCDRIYQIKNGSVAKEGSPEEMLNNLNHE